MKKILKSYFPFLITILFMFVMGYLFSFMYETINTIDSLNMTKEITLYTIILFFITLITVIGTWVEIIAYIIHVAKHSEIKNNWLWAILIYLFNIFVIPYYNLKYVVKSGKIKIKIIILIVLSLLSFISGFILTNNIVDKYNYYSIENVSTQNYKSENDIVSMIVPDSYTKEDEEAWDLYFFDYERGIEIGVTTLELSKYDITQEEAIDVLALNISSNNLLSSDKIEKEDKIIETKIYSGIYNEEEYSYRISAIQYNDNSKYLVCVVEITLKEDMNKYEDELVQIVENIKINEK